MSENFYGGGQVDEMGTSLDEPTKKTPRSTAIEELYGPFWKSIGELFDQWQKDAVARALQ